MKYQPIRYGNLIHFKPVPEYISYIMENESPYQFLLESLRNFTIDRYEEPKKIEMSRELSILLLKDRDVFKHLSGIRLTEFYGFPVEISEELENNEIRIY